MKLVSVFAVLLVALSEAQAGQDELEKILMDKLQALEDVTKALKTVIDSKTAAVATAKMDASLERLIVCDEVLVDQKTVARLKKEKLDDKYGKRLVDAQAAMQKELDRLAKQPTVLKGIAEAAAWKRWQSLPKASDATAKVFIDPNKLERTRLDLKSLDVALTFYFTRQGSYPESLADLTKRQPDGGAAILKDEGLKDAWDRPYQYDPKEREPKTDRPRVWSQGPSPGQPGSEIANWTADPPPRKK